MPGMWSNLRPTIKCPMKPLPKKMEWFTPKKASGKYNETWLLISSTGNFHRHTLSNMLSMSHYGIPKRYKCES